MNDVHTQSSKAAAAAESAVPAASAWTWPNVAAPCTRKYKMLLNLKRFGN